MSLYKYLLVFILIVFTINAKEVQNIKYLEDSNKSNVLLKDFLSLSTDKYTIVLGTLITSKKISLKYLKKFNIKSNVIVYKYGYNNNYSVVLYGSFDAYEGAKDSLNNLHDVLLLSKPYISKLKKQQDLYKKYNNQSRVFKKPNQSRIQKNIYFNENSKLKNKFLNKSSKYYAIALATIPSNKNGFAKYIKRHQLGKEVIFHSFGKKKKYTRVIYGIYKTKKEANNAIAFLSNRLKKAKPFSLKLSKFQSFFKKQNINILSSKNDVLKIQNKKIKLNIENKKIKPKIKEQNKKIQTTSKVIISLPKNFKSSYIKDVYYTKNDDNFNILEEVFLKSDSSFYSIDLGGINLNNVNINDFLEKQNIYNDVLLYRYGKDNNFARIIIGAYENEEEAQASKALLNIKQNTKISNIKEHNNRYKKSHDKIIIKN